MIFNSIYKKVDKGILTSVSDLLDLYELEPDTARPSKLLFRGQKEDHELIPMSYRNSKWEKIIDKEDPQIDGFFATRQANGDLVMFIDLAKKQNLFFPKNPFDQMSIAQHYSVKTPLLDWTSNILIATYFAIGTIDGLDHLLQDDAYIYRLILDSEVFIQTKENFNETKFYDFDYHLAFIPDINDRRIERQFSVQTYIPHPFHGKAQIEVEKYKLDNNLISKLLIYLQNLGYKSSYLFPDYAGISNAIYKGYIL